MGKMLIVALRVLTCVTVVSLGVLVLLAFPEATAQANEIDDVQNFSKSLWEPNAPWCADKTGRRFPSKVKGDGSCDDRDSVMFNGLLCVSGFDVACEAVLNSQDTATRFPLRGEWWRSPRIALDPSIPRSDSFSADQNIGVMMTIVHRRQDAATLNRLVEWLDWINVNRPCIVGSEPLCVRGLARLCRDDTEMGCTMKPGDIATMSATLERLSIPVPDGPFMKDLFDYFKAYALPIILANSYVNEEDYPMHLVAASIMIFREFDPSGDLPPLLLGAAQELSRRQPANPFFAFLAAKPKLEVAQKVLALCPKSQAEIPTEKTQWTWERPDGSQANKNTMLWDCVFMSNLLKQ